MMCLREFPVIDGIAKKFGEDKLAVLTINDDSNIKKVQTVFEKTDSSLPVLIDKGSKVVRAYQAYTIPLYYLVDQEQNISQVWVGSVKGRESELEEKIAGLLPS